MGTQGKTLIIAEAGVNTNGDLDTALKMVDAAKEAGADVCKFQTFFDVPKYNHLRHGQDEWVKIVAHCDDVGIEFMSTPEGTEECYFLCALGVRAIKIGSDNLTNYDLIRLCAQKGKDTYISTGKAKHTGEILHAKWEFLVNMAEVPTPNLTFLHCVSEYPTDPSKMDLSTITDIQSETGPFVGLSDHTMSVTEIPCMAVALGATVIEKHFTLDRNQDGEDHHMSLEPEELKRMCEWIRIAEKAMS